MGKGNFEKPPKNTGGEKGKKFENEPPFDIYTEDAGGDFMLVQLQKVPRDDGKEGEQYKIIKFSRDGEDIDENEEGIPVVAYGQMRDNDVFSDETSPHDGSGVGYDGLSHMGATYANDADHFASGVTWKNGGEWDVKIDFSSRTARVPNRETLERIFGREMEIEFIEPVDPYAGRDPGYNNEDE